MAGCRHGPEMGTHRGDGRWTAPAGGHTRSVSSLGSPGAVPGVVWAFERFSAGASDAARFALFQTKPGNPEEFFRLPAKELNVNDMIRYSGLKSQMGLGALPISPRG